MNESGRYWDKPWSLIDGCTPCSPGCDHCWSAVMTHRFNFQWTKDGKPEFNGHITVRPERLDIPLKRKKPTVYAVWNDLFHEDVPITFINSAFLRMVKYDWHTYLTLTKRPKEMKDFVTIGNGWRGTMQNVYLGLTICNQQEADEKIPIFLQVSGKKFLSIEPMLGEIKLQLVGCPNCGQSKQDWFPNYTLCRACGIEVKSPPGSVDAVILGGESGPGARPMHPDWVRSVRDQCAAAGVPFFFKQWGEWKQCDEWHEECPGHKMNVICHDGTYPLPGVDWTKIVGAIPIYRAGRKAAGRILDGRTHDDLPWRSNA